MRLFAGLPTLFMKSIFTMDYEVKWIHEKYDGE